MRTIVAFVAVLIGLSSSFAESLSIPLQSIQSKTVVSAAGTNVYETIGGAGMYGLNNAGAMTEATNTAALGGPIALGAGTLRVHGRIPALEALDCEAKLPTNGLILRFDASCAESVVLADDGSSVTRWKDLVGGYDAVPVEKIALPVLRRGELGERAVVDFSGHQGVNSDLVRDSAMRFVKDLTTAKSIFWVVGSSLGGGALLASKSTGAQVFPRGTAATRWNQWAAAGADMRDPLLSSAALAGSADFRLNGVDVVPTVASPSGGYDIISAVSSEAFATLNGLAATVVFSVDNAIGRGRQQLAELIVYDVALSDLERRQVEKYLYEKWLRSAGTIRHLQAVGGGTGAVEVPADGSATVENISGRGTMTKSGDGTLVVDNYGAFGGTLAPQAGTLVLGTASDAPAFGGEHAFPANGLLLHLDASRADTLTMADGLVTEWRDASAGSVKAVFSEDDGVSFAGRNAPALRPAGMNGLNAVDMGFAGSGQYLKFSSNLTGIKTVLMAVNAAGGGGYCLSTTSSGSKIPFMRGQIPILATKTFAYSSDYPLLYIEDAAQWCYVWLDGKMVDPMLTSYSGGDQILTLVPTSANGGSADGLCLDCGLIGHSGGMCYGEILVYDRILTETERCAAEAYLREKWVVPARIGTLSLTGNATLKTEGDVTVDRVIGSGRLTKTGAGRLTVRGKSAAFTGSISADEGKVTYIRKGEVPTELPVAGPSFWFDPSDAETLTLDGENVTAIASPDGKAVSAAPTGTTAPTLKDKALNGLSVLDMGAHLSGRNLTFSAPQTGLRTLFVVWGTNPNGGHLLGNSANTSMFKRETIWWKSLFHSNALAALRQGMIRMNGESLGPDETFKFDSTGFQLIAIESCAPVTVDNLGETEGGYGGMQYGEVIGYDRLLSSEEFDAVEAYLACKWFGKASNGYTKPGETVHGGIDTDGRFTIDVEAGKTEDALWVVGSGTVAKGGAGELDIAGNTAGFAGTFDIAEGVLKYTAPQPSATLQVTDGLIRDFDASAEDALEFDENGQIVKWNDSVSDHYAGPTTHSVKRYPKTTTIEATGRTVVDFGAFGMWQPNLHFDVAVSPTTVFWLLGSQEGGGFLLGGKDQAYWNRGYIADGANKLYTKDAPLYFFSGSDWYATAAYNGKSYVDGQEVAANQKGVLNGDYQVVCTVCNAANQAAGFALQKIGAGQNCGGQRLGEVLFYDRALSDEERVSVENYLAMKWLGRSTLPPKSDAMAKDAARSGALRVSAGGTFDLNGFTHTTGSLLCAGGAVRGGTLVVTDALVITEGGLTVYGDLILRDGVRIVTTGEHAVTVTGKVVVEGLGTFGVPAELAPIRGLNSIVVAPAIEGYRSIREWTIDPDEAYLQEGYRLSATAQGIVFKSSHVGFQMIVR